MKERPVLFGDPKILLGILTEPQDATAAGRPAVLLLNAGLVHRPGPHRMSVRLARELARRGFPAFRFDLSGVGDSEPRRDNLSYADRAILDVRQALDHLEKTRGVRRVVAMGLCSGADNAYFTSLQDTRIVGIVAMDGFAYRTPRFYAQHYGRKALSLSSWRTLAKRARSKALSRLERFGFGKAASAHGAATEKVPSYVREFPPKEEFRKGLETLTARGVRLLMLYSAGMHEYYTYEGQFADAFPGLGAAVDARFFPGANHTFTELRMQDELVSTIVRWTSSLFSDA